MAKCDTPLTTDVDKHALGVWRRTPFTVTAGLGMSLWLITNVFATMPAGYALYVLIPTAFWYCTVRWLGPDEPQFLPVLRHDTCRQSNPHRR